MIKLTAPGGADLFVRAASIEAVAKSGYANAETELRLASGTLLVESPDTTTAQLQTFGALTFRDGTGPGLRHVRLKPGRSPCRQSRRRQETPAKRILHVMKEL